MGISRDPSNNGYSARKDNEKYLRPPPPTISPTTATALKELEFITSWNEFVAICEAQKIKRGY